MDLYWVTIMSPAPLISTGILSLRDVKVDLMYIAAMYRCPVMLLFLLSVLCPALSMNDTSLLANTTSKFPGTTVGFSCEGYTILNGSNFVKCLNGGHWSSSPPVCQEGTHFFVLKIMLRRWGRLNSTLLS